MHAGAGVLPKGQALAVRGVQVDMAVTVAFEAGTVVTVSDMRKSDDMLLEPLPAGAIIPHHAAADYLLFYPGEGPGAAAPLTAYVESAWPPTTPL